MLLFNESVQGQHAFTNPRNNDIVHICIPIYIYIQRERETFKCMHMCICTMQYV